MRVYGLTSRDTFPTNATATAEEGAAESLRRAFDPDYRPAPSVLDGVILTARIPLSVNGVPVKATTDARTDRKRTNRQLRAAVKLETPAVTLVACVCSHLLTEDNQTTGCSAMVAPTARNEGYAPGHADRTAQFLGDAMTSGVMIYNSLTDDLLSAEDTARALGYDVIEADETAPAV